MKRAILIGILLAAAACTAYFFFFAGKEKTVSVLVFSRTKGFRHESISAGKKALIEMGKQKGFRVDTTEDAGMFKEKYLRHYNVVVFLNTTGDVLNPSQQLVFNRFIQGGGGFVGIHSAADTEYDWEWYGNLVGAYFKGHPNNPNVRQATVRIVDKKHPATKNLPSEWSRSDEWYNYKGIKSHIHVLAEVDESTYEGGENGPHHPISWYHEFDGGHSFYTGLGHTAESFSEKAFLEMLHGGIEYAAGNGQLVDFGKASAAPEETRFSKVVLQENLDEPMELALLPDRSVLFVERKGRLRMFSPGADSARTIARLNVHTGHEDGLLGIAIDPAYAQNHWIYLFYSPAGDVPKQHISRFVLENGKLDLTSEKILLEVPTQREECCHSAGSMEWGPDGLLYISLGDNTNPHGASGFAPLDEQEGRSSWDAQRSAGNTMDLRGKILRIKPEADGTYSIPEGNLFPKDGKSGRPEIYIMGCRNPFRISVDQHTGFLYWGEVGPDAGEDSTHRGPKGHDEVNQARAAGNFGWPYFVGDNKAYKDFDFSKGKSGEAFNPQSPLNQSINNTGSQQLPPANKAFVWYPYSPSPEFPQVGDGSRNAMAGPVFYATDYPESPSRFPDYYDGKLFIYDWVRGWIMAVTMDDEGNYLHMERFMPGNTFSNPMDMLWGPDGDLYMLEYGTKWFSQNTDARLVHITYTAGNRPPKAALAASKTVGAVPLVVQADASQTVDYDKDSLKYEWLINGKPADAQGISPTFTFSQPGEYTLTLIAKDPQGLSSRKDLQILAGNEMPVISWNFEGNRSFFFDNQTISYEVLLNDAEDGKPGAGISEDALNISIDYLPDGKDITLIAQGHQAQMEASAFAVGKQLIAGSDCAACHQEKENSVGPSFLAVAQRYKNEVKAVEYLGNKIVQGGGGVWGQTAMAAHPQLSIEQTSQMARYILSLSGRKDLAVKQPVRGSQTLSGDKGAYYLHASYTDKGAKGAKPLTATQTLVLRHPRVQAEDCDVIKGGLTYDVKAGQVPGIDQDISIVVGIKDSYIAYKGLDLSGIALLEAQVGLVTNITGGGSVEIRLDRPDGEIIGTIDASQKMIEAGFGLKSSTLKPVSGTHDLYFIFTGKDTQKPVCVLDWIWFKKGSGI